MKYIYLTIGFISLGLGLLGIPLPILPTTPFLLLSAICFSASSPKVDAWFKSTSFYKRYVKDYKESKSITKKNKIKLLITVTVLMSIGFYFSKVLIARIIVGIVLIGHYYYFIFKVKTSDEKQEKHLQN